ncbi:hypothetical protein ACWGLE_01020 [Streptomyces sp. NPDC055897]
MATFPAIDPAGVAFQLQLFSGAVGGIPVVVAFPQDYAQRPAAEPDIQAFAAALAARWEMDVTSITRYATTSSELAGS